jgi:hypothetical protein
MPATAVNDIQSLLADDADPRWLAETIDGDEACRLLGISSSGLSRRVSNGWTRFAMNGRKFVFTRAWIREAMLREAEAHRERRGIAKQTKSTNAEADREAWEARARQFQSALVGGK